MKTKHLLFAGLLITGFVFLSFQSDKDLSGGKEFAKDVNTVLAADLRSTAPGGLLDVLTNYPDPFTDKTLIEYRVLRPAWVEIMVYNREEQFAIRLISEFHREGIYRVEFDATELPVGEYLAEMKVGLMSYKEVMTKVFKTSIGGIPKDF